MSPDAVPHTGSHLGALAPSAPTGIGRVDAVIVPSGRTAEHVRSAAELAAGLNAVLVALCSAESFAAAVATVIDDVPGLRWHAADVDPRHDHALLPRHRAVPGHGGRVSLSLKRNAGLMLAKMVGWDTVLFLDDDIRGISPDVVSLAAGGLVSASAVGLAVQDWPDNSVACHANRLGGGQQEVFVGGSALLVDVTADDLGHFPVVYNEDWLFLHDALAAQRVRREGAVRQLPYDPFGDPRRGAGEEFGEVIAEGLVAWVEAGGTGVPIDPGYWAAFLPRRAAFLAQARRGVLAGTRTPRHRAALRALDAAIARNAEIRAGSCVRFLRGWRADRAAWRRRFVAAPAVDDVGKALCELGLGGALSHRPGGAVARPSRSRAPLDASVQRAPAAEGTALIVPGFLDGRDSRAHRSLAAALPSAGLTAVTFDPRGTATGPEPLQAGPTEQLADIGTLLDQHLGAGRRVLVGHCYGAWLACLTAAADPRMTEVVAIMPTRCFLWPRDYDPDADSWRRRGTRVFFAPVPGSTRVRRHELPHDVVEDARLYDLPAALARLRVPILFVAGDADTVIPAESVQRLHDECGSTEKAIAVLPGVQHDYRDHPEQIAAVENAVVGWLAARRTRPAPV